MTQFYSYINYTIKFHNLTKHQVEKVKTKLFLFDGIEVTWESPLSKTPVIFFFGLFAVIQFCT